MNYEEAMSYIQNTAKFGSNYGLSRTERILELLQNPHKKIKCIHIAGTNGKGSTTAMLSSILQKSGYKTGIFISPFLEQFEERIQINNEYISKSALTRNVSKVAEAVDIVVSEGYEQPTEFEIITCVMFLYFFEEGIDYAIVEVGLGGRLDSTNVITPILSIIASISYDHMNILGNSIAEIAMEKAGIIKHGVPVVVYPQSDEVISVIKAVSKEKNSPMRAVSKQSAEFIRCENYKQLIKIETQNDTYEITLNLLGSHQVLNCTLVVNAVEELKKQGLNISKDHVLQALSIVSWPGRMEIMKKNPLILIDGAHNIDGIEKLTESIRTYFQYDKLYLIIGILSDKQVCDMAQTIVKEAEAVFTVTPNSERAETASELKDIVVNYNTHCEAVDNYREAVRRAYAKCSGRDILVICGSLYMIGDMRKIIREEIEYRS